MLLTGLMEYINSVSDLPPEMIPISMLPAMMGLLLGYPVGGVLGDFFFRYRKNGRLVACLFGMVIPSLFLFRAMQAEDVQGQTFLISVLLVSFFMAFVLPNLFASLMDVALPEIRATASAVGLLFQSISIMVTPWIFSVFKGYFSIGDAILWLGIGMWSLCTLICVGLFFFIPGDVENHRRHMAYRSHLEARLKYAP
jgi:hypothetical protein